MNKENRLIFAGIEDQRNPISEIWTSKYYWSHNVEFWWQLLEKIDNNLNMV